MSIGRSLALLLMARHAQWLLDHDGDSRGCHSARIFCLRGIDLVDDRADYSLARGLMDDAVG
jgi:hypothetical protein